MLGLPPVVIGCLTTGLMLSEAGDLWGLNIFSIFGTLTILCIMKLLKYLAIAASVALTSMAFTACGNDEPGGGDNTENGSDGKEDDGDDDGDDTVTWVLNYYEMKSMGDYTFVYANIGSFFHHSPLNPFPLKSILYKGKTVVDIDYDKNKIVFSDYSGKGTYTCDYRITHENGRITEISGSEGVTGSDRDYFKVMTLSCQSGGFTLDEETTYNPETRSQVKTSLYIREQNAGTSDKIAYFRDDNGENIIEGYWVREFKYDGDEIFTDQTPMAFSAGPYSPLKGIMRVLAAAGAFNEGFFKIPSSMHGEYQSSTVGDNYTGRTGLPMSEEWTFSYDDLMDLEGAAFQIYSKETDRRISRIDLDGNEAVSSDEPDTFVYNYTFDQKHITGTELNNMKARRK